MLKWVWQPDRVVIFGRCFKNSSQSEMAGTAPETDLPQGFSSCLLGESVQPWKLESSQGNCSLQSKKFIIAQPSGSYHVSCKVNIFDHRSEPN